MSDNLLVLVALIAAFVAVCFHQEAPAASDLEDPVSSYVSIYLPPAVGADLLPYEEAYLIAIERCNVLVEDLRLDRTQDEAAIGINKDVDLDCLDMATF